MTHPVAFFEIVSPDPERARRFYADVFGWTYEVDDDGYALVDTGAGDGAVTGGIGPSEADGDVGVKIYVRTDDLEGSLTKVKAAGGETVLPPMDLPGGFGTIAVVVDLDGNPLGLWS